MLLPTAIYQNTVPLDAMLNVKLKNHIGGHKAA